jgi:hypothetical protein
MWCFGWLVYGVWCMVYGVWCMVYGVWCMVYGVWCMVYGVVCCMLYVVWCMVLYVVEAREGPQVHHTPYTIHHTPYTIHHTPYTIHQPTKAPHHMHNLKPKRSCASRENDATFPSLCVTVNLVSDHATRRWRGSVRQAH